MSAAADGTQAAVAAGAAAGFDPYLALLFMVLLTTAGQILAKRGALRISIRHGFGRLLRTMANWPLALGGLSVVAAPVLYMYALSHLPLSIGYSFSGLTYLLVVLTGHLLLKERITLYHIAGTLCILAGLSVWNLT
ncbi:MAG: EamA family transporter [Spirochaetota bacterium]